MILEDLVARALKLDRLAVSKLLSLIESNPEHAGAVSSLWSSKVNSHVIAITGSPGVGKSTLISALADELTLSGYTVAILALDPSSPLTGGSLLGDRVRMQGIRCSDRVFIRSMSVSPSESVPLKALLAIELFNALGFDYVMLETPGLGQVNTEVSSVADTTVLVLMPGSGDEVQALKAGIMEVCDIYVINKSDMHGADITLNQVLFALGDGDRDGWVPRVLKASALTKTGIRDLVRALKDHRNYLMGSGKLEERVRLRRALELDLAIKRKVMSRLRELLGSDPTVRAVYERVASGYLDPITAADRVVRAILSG